MTILGVDVWEGNPDLDEAILLAAGVKFIAIRLNDINGGHHMDENFAEQWAQAEGFIRWPYFVYNPWKSGLENFEWLFGRIPAEARAVSIDIEVRKAGYSPTTYANQVADFVSRARLVWNINIYSGAWFLPCLAQWPGDVEYWWARYPYSLYPPSTQRITWEQLAQKLAATPWQPGTTPGPCRMWQCTADRYILPGCSTHLDINLWNGTLEDLAAWAGQQTLPPQDWRWAVTGFIRQLGYTGPDPD